MRKNTAAFCGGAYGDEGKGRIVDWYVNKFARKGPVVVFRDNGGANAGHTVEVGDTRIALHQLPSGVMIEGVKLLLGKGMVIHPGDLIQEIESVEKATGKSLSKRIKLDELAVLTLDTHRAFETVLKNWQKGGSGSTGRGISPAYADVLLRHPVRVRDIVPFHTNSIAAHYQLYQSLISGLGQDLSSTRVVTAAGEMMPVGSEKEFIQRLRTQAKKLNIFVTNLVPLLIKYWQDKQLGIVCEKAQAIGLDARWGVYPDVTASDTTFAGIQAATEGAFNIDEIPLRAAVIKATYMSSVGARQLPTHMTGALANQIRRDADEYGATTKRPRDIAYLDLPAIRFFLKVGGVKQLILTHMDIIYDQPLKICVDYKLNGKSVSYRPDQVYLNKVTPVFQNLKPWKRAEIQAAQSKKDLPFAANHYVEFLEKELHIKIPMITTGPKREQTILLS